MNITVEQTLEMPNAVLFARKLDAALKAEQKKRKHFYETFQEDQKVEFINGETIFQSPAKLWHTQAVGNLSSLISAYVKIHSLGVVATEKLLISLTRNDYEPDIVFFNREKAKDFEPKRMQFPAPDFIVEVLSESTERYDRQTKFLDYAAHDVGEYWIINPEKQIVEQYLLVDEDYELTLKAGGGMIESVAVDGFQIPVRAIFDDAENIAALRKIISD